MGGDWDYINEHMGGHDDDGIPNFVHEYFGFENVEYDDQYVVYNSLETLEKYPRWIGRYGLLGKLLGLSVEEALAIEALRTLAWSLETRRDHAAHSFEFELGFYENDKAEFESGNYHGFVAEEILERKALVDEKELAFKIAYDEFEVINNAYSRARWLAHLPIEERAILSAEARLPAEELTELVEIPVPGATYPLFVATTQLSIDITAKNDNLGLGYGSHTFKTDRKLVLDPVKSDGSTLDIFDTFETFKDDRELMLEALTEYSWALDDTSDTFKNDDRELVLEAIKNHGFDLCNASSALRDDREIALEAVRHDGFSLKYVSNALKADREVVLEAVRLDRYSHKHRAHYLKSLGYDDTPLKYASDTLRDDREIALEAVRHVGFSLKYVSNALKADREVVLEAVRQYRYSHKHSAQLFNPGNDDTPLKYASDTLRDDREIALEAVRHDGFSLKYVSNALKADREVVLEAVRQYKHSFEYASDTLKADQELQSIVDAIRPF